MLVSSFEVLLDAIGAPNTSTAAGSDESAVNEVPENAPKAGDVLRSCFVPPELAASGLPFDVPSALQGYFLYLSNPTSSPASGIEVGFDSLDPKVMSALVPAGSGTPAFLAITNTQPPLLQSTSSGISLGGLTPFGGYRAVTKIPTIPASGTVFVALVPNYVNPAVVKGGPSARGTVNIRTTNGTTASLNISAQTRVVFFKPDPTGGPGEVTGEAAYSMPSPQGGSEFIFSGV